MQGKAVQRKISVPQNNIQHINRRNNLEVQLYSLPHDESLIFTLIHYKTMYGWFSQVTTLGTVK
jgi:hypothetical protein